MEDKEREDVLVRWESMWNEFLQWVIQEYGDLLPAHAG